MMEFIRKHRNPLLLSALLITLAASYFFTQQRLLESSTTVSLPVEQVSAPASSALEEYRSRREATYLQDVATLEALCAQENLSAQTREDAAAQLQSLIATRQSQLALEGALVESGIAPCLAVISPGSVTVVTGKESISDGESALIMTLAQSHAGVAPSGVRVMTAGK